VCESGSACASERDAYGLWEGPVGCGCGKCVMVGAGVMRGEKADL
jgi:hypothetical protein